MARRLLEVAVAAAGLLLGAPLLAVAALGIRLSSPGPVLYRAVRVGRHGRLFVMYKLRTMHARTEAGTSRITGAADARVFPFGSLLRRVKLDELPQLWNVLRGDMALVGPRPEDPAIVHRHYGPLGMETLAVRPGLASPGSLYSSTHGEALLAAADAESAYAARLLPLKLALDAVYVRRASLAYDARVVARTLWVIGAGACGRRSFADPPEMADALRLLAAPARRPEPGGGARA